MNRHVCTCALFFALLLIALPAAGRKFAGHNCADDCSEHIAGYLWAEGRNLANPDDCRGTSRAFIEGCQAYVLGESLSVEEDEHDNPPLPPIGQTLP